MVRRPRETPTVLRDFIGGVVILGNAVTIYEDANFGGRSKTLGPGGYRFFMPEDFNDVVSSIRVPAGQCAVLYEHADDGGGYGVSVDLLEDCPDLSVYGFDNKVSYINVFPTTNAQGLVWVRNRRVNNEFIPGHWERPRAGGSQPDTATAVVSPPYPPHMPTAPTVMQVDGAQTTITFLGAQQPGEAAQWERAAADQMGVIGSDFRGPEEIGSAAFQRASTLPGMPDNLNFWYPLKQPRDHRSVVYFKRTLAGKVQRAKVYHQGKVFPDHDLNIYVVPNDKYTYLITEGHPREYTDVMRSQWIATAGQSGKPNCDDAESIAEFSWVEAEIQPDGDIRSGTDQKLLELIMARYGQDICIYGAWIYDKGHCCHPEIHPAEQIWWRNDVSATERKYTCCLFVDASQRFWWRDQMDDGTKLKPWAAPPIRGIFAIAFEVELGKPALRFEVANINHWNVADVSNGDQVYDLLYQNNVLVTFIPHNSAFKVSYENVGQVSANKVRGFLVLETSVGSVTQTTTRLSIPSPSPPLLDLTIEIPPGTDVNAIDQRLERRIFKKEEGRYMFTVTQTDSQTNVGRRGIWTSDFFNNVLRGTPTPSP